MYEYRKEVETTTIEEMKAILVSKGCTAGHAWEIGTEKYVGSYEIMPNSFGDDKAFVHFKEGGGLYIHWM